MYIHTYVFVWLKYYEGVPVKQAILQGASTISGGTCRRAKILISIYQYVLIRRLHWLKLNRIVAVSQLQINLWFSTQWSMQNTAVKFSTILIIKRIRRDRSELESRVKKLITEMAALLSHWLRLGIYSAAYSNKIQ